jgi:hypothetical protein
MSVILVEINHMGPYDFVLDTGSQVTSIDLSLAEELHLKNRGPIDVVGLGFLTHATLAQPDTLEVGSKTMADPVVVVQNLGYLQVADPHIRGILGGNSLEHLDVLIDYVHGILCLDDAKVMQPDLKGRHIALVTLPHPHDAVLSVVPGDLKSIRVPTEPLIIPVHLSGVAARAVLLLLDSGISIPFLYDVGKNVGGGFSVRMPLRDRGPDGIERVFSVLRPQDMEVGALTLHQISFVTPTATRKDIPREEVDGLLPTALFRSIYISYTDRFVVLEPW